MGKIRFPLILCLSTLLLFSCGGERPLISDLRWSMNLHFTPRLGEDFPLDNANTRGAETLALFIAASDPDGFADLDSMYLINEENDLFWALSSSQWATFNNGGTVWIGSNNFDSAYLPKLPRGNYKVQLYDQAGEFSQYEFIMNAPDTSELSREVSVPPVGDELTLLLPPGISLYSITGYDVSNNPLFTDANYQSIISLRNLKVQNEELDKVMLYFQLPNSEVYAYIGPYIVPRVGSQSSEAKPVDVEPPSGALDEQAPSASSARNSINPVLIPSSPPPIQPKSEDQPSTTP